MQQEHVCELLITGSGDNAAAMGHRSNRTHAIGAESQKEMGARYNHTDREKRNDTSCLPKLSPRPHGAQVGCPRSPPPSQSHVLDHTGVSSEASSHSEAPTTHRTPNDLAIGSTRLAITSV
jgi:hypothetical protein